MTCLSTSKATSPIRWQWPRWYLGTVLSFICRKSYKLLLIRTQSSEFFRAAICLSSCLILSSDVVSAFWCITARCGWLAAVICNFLRDSWISSTLLLSSANSSLSDLLFALFSCKTSWFSVDFNWTQEIFQKNLRLPVVLPPLCYTPSVAQTWPGASPHSRVQALMFEVQAEQSGFLCCVPHQEPIYHLFL